MLRGRDAQPGAGLEEELIDLDIRRQLAGMQGKRIGEIGRAAENAFRERPQEARFEAGLGARLLERQGGEDAEMNRGVGGRARKQGIGDVIGLAEAERQSQHDGLADTGDDRIGHLICVIEVARATGAAHYFKSFQPGSGRKRSP